MRKVILESARIATESSLLHTQVEITPYIVATDGFGPVDTTIMTDKLYGAGGDIVHGTYRTGRQLIITMQTAPPYTVWPFDRNTKPADFRRYMYAFFPAGSKVRVKTVDPLSHELDDLSTDDVWYYVDGVVKSIQCNPYQNPQLMQLTIMCESVYWTKETPIEYTANPSDGNPAKVNISNYGDVPVGIYAQVEVDQKDLVYISFEAGGLTTEVNNVFRRRAYQIRMSTVPGDTYCIANVGDLGSRMYGDSVRIRPQFECARTNPDVIETDTLTITVSSGPMSSTQSYATTIKIQPMLVGV